MIFSRQNSEIAMTYMAIYYDKILLANFAQDTFIPIKVSSTEWGKTRKGITLSEWLKDFMSSDMYKDPDRSLEELADLEKMERKLSPSVYMYDKLIDGHYHTVQAEVIPIGAGLAYIFVKDLTKMSDGFVIEEE